jgi:cytochrome oxidase Cu insertion factor (SCO1/SenC/PrrC family)
LRRALPPASVRPQMIHTAEASDNPEPSRGGTMIAPGKEAPDFELEDHRGQRVRLAALRGKTVVLWFYPKADTPG